MICAYHAIFCTYGFWLPNDPRGSWSALVGSKALRQFGGVVPANTKRSLAYRPHNVSQRLAAKQSLAREPVVFNGVQARAVARGFALAVEKSRYQILACAIMPNHVHLVVVRHTQSIERIVGHLKGRASKQLELEALHPFLQDRLPDGELPSPWAEKCWSVFLKSEADVFRAVRYVNDNPVRAGFRRQAWRFVCATPNGG
jgi:REP element-mobilizing transposase RayT